MPSYSLDLSFLPDWVPNWAVGLALIAAALVAAVALHGWIVRALARGLRKRGDFTRSLLVRTRSPSRFALLVGALSWSIHVAPVDARVEGVLQHILLVAFIILLGWAVMTAFDIAAALYLRRHRTDAADNLHARKQLTQTRILRRSINAVVLVITIAAALMTIPGVKQFGVSLLAAGGAAGIIVGLALQPVLSNVFAGIQIAFTQPIRIDDAVTINNEFGYVEEIKATYVVIRLRDGRRMIVPLKFFLEQPFQNWTREASELVTEILFQVDQRVPIDRLRTTVESLAKASSRWDGREIRMQVNDIREKTIEIRCLASARNAADATELRADIREGVIIWLQREYPGALAHNGVEAPAPLVEPTPVRPPARSRRPAGSKGKAASAAPRRARPS